MARKAARALVIEDMLISTDVNKGSDLVVYIDKLEGLKVDVVSCEFTAYV